MSDILKKNTNTFFKSVNDRGETIFNESAINICFKYDKTEYIKLMNEEEYDRLIEVKNKIDELEDCKVWDKIKKISNAFELIYLPNKKIKSTSVSKYEPLSRSYFKLWEIIHDFNLINQLQPIKVAGLAEGPGGFIEAVINYRKKFKNICKSDHVYGITLMSFDKDIPCWNKATNFLKKNPNVSVHYGKDETGNIYNIENIEHFASNFNHDADLVTADGGFDFSTNFNKQEQTSLRIIFCEIVTALSIQKKGGTFVCKVYDTYTHVSVSFLFLLSCLYDTINLTKPFTSRPANSEKYLVCNGFKGISPILLKKLHILVRSWEIIDKNGKYIRSIIDFDKIPQSFKDTVRHFNTIFFNHQVQNIEKTLLYIEKFNIGNQATTNHSTSNHMNNVYFYKETVNKQVYYAFNWCKKYKCKINYDSELILNSNISLPSKKYNFNENWKNGVKVI